MEKPASNLIKAIISNTSSGITICIRVNTKSSRLGLQKISNNQLVWGISAAPEDGKANKMLIDQVSKFFDLAKSNVSIIKGEKSKDKIILMQSIDSDHVAQKLDKLDF